MTRSASPSSSTRSSGSPHRHSGRHSSPPRRRRSRSRRHGSRSPGRGRSRDSPPRRGGSRDPPTRRGRSPTRSPDRRPSHSEEDNFDYEAAYKILRAENERKRRKGGGGSTSTSAQAQGRGIRKTCALFGEIYHIILDAQAYERAPMPDDHGIDEFSSETTDEELAWLAKKRGHERNYQAYIEIDRLIPGLAGKIAKMTLDERADHFTLLQKGANDARSDDFRRVSAGLSTMINHDRDKPELLIFDHGPFITVTDQTTGDIRSVKQRAPLLGRNRNTRGVGNDVTGALLTSTAMDWNNPDTRAKVRGAQVDIGADFFMRIFYRDFHGDPKEVQEGFTQSAYMVKSYKAVFTAPSSVEQDDDENTPPLKKAKGPNGKCVAVRLGMNGKVTGRSIAYIAVLLWLSLTTATTWTDEYYNVSLPQMYDFFVDYFEGPAEGTQARERADELLAWWNMQIFPAHASSAATNKTAAASRTALREQRAAMEL
ncbi:hypothetical protein MVEN_00484900 [Mycena venus]|uniref:Uncharacterized protein n=1 Tax=Mycena venus TaxID=2733690 RepID=A0A8H7DC02_9AGAR|nr:hypothetical protein MVEN_00484900 [Mycena venus]